MIQANELRIGNYLKTPECAFMTIKTLKQDDDDILVNERNGMFTLNYTAFPIPLTEEILLKCGFVNDGGDWKIRIYGEDNRFYIGWFVLFISYDYKTDSRKYVVPMGDYRNETEADVKYLHQLQNLYFALTGKELEVKL